MAAAAQPWTSLQKINQPAVGASPQKAEVKVKPAIPKMKVNFLP
jgi:hypothetical protein